MTGRLIHLNGAPGAGKSTLARALVAHRPGWLNLDIDLLRRLVGGWDDDHAGTGDVVRPLALAMITAHLAGGRDVVLPQLLADADELERFAGAARSVGAEYVGVLLGLPDAEIAIRWRRRDTSDPSTAANNRVIESQGGDRVVLSWAQKVRELARSRTDTIVLDVSGLAPAESLVRLEAALDARASTSPACGGS